MSGNHGISKIAVSGAVAAAAVLGCGILSTPNAEAATVKAKAYSVAKSEINKPYKYGAAGPTRFDCSGLMQYSFKKAGKKLTRTAQSQYNHTKHISAKSRQVGDLVFFGKSSKRITHVGIYAGSSKIINANTGHYRGYKVVKAPIKEYTYGGLHTYYGRVK